MSPPAPRWAGRIGPGTTNMGDIHDQDGRPLERGPFCLPLSLLLPVLQSIEVPLGKSSRPAEGGKEKAQDDLINIWKYHVEKGPFPQVMRLLQ